MGEKQVTFSIQDGIYAIFQAGEKYDKLYVDEGPLFGRITKMNFRLKW